MPRTAVLSPIRKQIYDFILSFKAEHDGNSPSIRDIADKFHRSTSMVNYYLNYMESIGLIWRGEKGVSRMIQVTGATWNPPSTQDEPAEQITTLTGGE
jgi:predicted transcriptional regulator